MSNHQKDTSQAQPKADNGAEHKAREVDRLISEIVADHGQGQAASLLATLLLRLFSESRRKRWSFRSIYGEIAVQRPADQPDRVH